MAKIQYPKPLEQGDKIAICAFYECYKATQKNSIELLVKSNYCRRALIFFFLWKGPAALAVLWEQWYRSREQYGS